MMKTLKILLLIFTILSAVSCEKEEPVLLDNTSLKYDRFQNPKQFFTPKKCASLKFKLRTKEDQMGGFAGNAMVNFRGKIWSVGGYQNGLSYPNQTNSVWSSGNGTNWVSLPTTYFPERDGHTLTVFQNKMWLIGGTNGSGNQLSDVWYSSDGTNWRLATNTPEFGYATGHSTTVFKNVLIVFKGDDVWVSKDGVRWKMIANDIFPSRFYSELITFNNKLYLIGGENGLGTYYNEIWESSNGSNWTRVSTSGPVFSSRSRHTATIYNKKVWIIGGTEETGFDSDEVWSSNDMRVWCENESSAPFTRLSSHSSLALGDSIWVFGGFSSFGMSRKIWSFKNY